MLLLNYDIEVALECEPRIKECCEPDKKPGQPTGSGDCCYDTWTKEFKGVDAEFNRADKRVTYLTNRLNHLGTQRDMWKTWKDELDKACDASKKICDQLEIVLHHTGRISKNVWLTKRSINLLYCMLRDFFMQVDHLKKKYDYLINCIKCLNNPALGSGQGIMVFIEAYGTKLDAVIQTRDTLIEQIIAAISIANNINKNIGHHGHHYGLRAVLIEWKRVFNCERKGDDDDSERRRYDSGRGDRYRNTPEGEIEDIGLEPVFKFPICESDYYKKIDSRYKDDNGDYNKLSKQLLHETKHRDNLKALRDGLTSVMSDADVDPSKRCGTNGTK
jgi:hypothetical protein